jgi:hypothetical protein
MNEILNRGFAYILSLSVITAVLIYTIDLPGYLTGAKDLVKEYYYRNAVGSFLLDIVIVALYISAAMYVTRAFGINSNAAELIAVAGTSAIISTLFMIFFKSGFAKNTFFSRWFDRVGMLAVMYDVILVSSIFVLMNVIYKRL